MILRFLVKNGHDLVAVDDQPPIVQESGGCRNMFGNAKIHDGIFISNKRIDGWNMDYSYSGYWYGNIPEYGGVISGSIKQNVLDALDFKFRNGSACWATGDNFHKLTYKQYKEYLDLPNTKAKEYLAGLYPVIVPMVEPPKPKKGRALKGADIALV